jgi:hypothetical protein
MGGFALPENGRQPRRDISCGGHIQLTWFPEKRKLRGTRCGRRKQNAVPKMRRVDDEFLD